jgi:hypothetical protein
LINKKAFLTSLMALTFTVGSFVTPISAFASSLGDSLEDMISQTTCKEKPIISNYSIANTEMLSKLRTINPAAYTLIPVDVLSDFLRQGTNKIMQTSTGFKLYLNSAIVKSIKYVGYGVASEISGDRGVVINFSTRGALVSWYQQ